jgi:hypothetical protein
MNTSIRNLPAYAQRADPAKLVRILCKGICCKTRWAEMNEDYPGDDALKNAQLGEFTAKCLVCGRVAHDNYNWLR